MPIVFVHNTLLIAPESRSVFVANEKIDLTRQEFDLLHYLVINHGRVLSYSQILKRIWGGDHESSERNVLWDAMKRLRGKLRTDPSGQEYIENVRDFGYWIPPVPEND